MIVVLSEEGEEGEEFEGIRPMAAEVAMIQARTRMIQTQIADMGNLNKFASGVYSGKIEGAMIGIVLSLGLLGLLILGGGV
jgi:tetrahydromethanopterin S-methyltransferase subunit A